MPEDTSGDRDGTSDNTHQTGEAESEAVWLTLAHGDPMLTGIIAAWPTLPANVRAAIVRMVRGSR